MKFAQKLAAIFKKLNLTSKAEKNTMTAKDWQAVRQAYKAEYNTDLDADQKEHAQSQKDAEQQRADAEKVQADNDAALKIVQSVLLQGKNPANKGGGANNNQNVPDNLVGAVTELSDRIGNMMGRMLPDNSVTVGSTPLQLNGPGTDAKHYLGINHSMFSMERRWNRIAQNPAYATLNPVNERKDGADFRDALGTYADKVARRINFHRANNTFNFKALSAGLDVTLAGNAGLGDQYVTIREDQLIARLLSVRNVYDIFPRRFGVQDREVMTNAFFGDFSQAYQEGAVFKGSIDLVPEIGYVDDSMMKTLFKSMKWLEREYIGYLNKEGSDPIKWSMIEWALLNIATKLIMEQNERKILGIYVKPETGKAGHRLNAGTGVFYTLLRYYNEGKMALMSDPAYASYETGSEFVGMVQDMARELSGKIDNFDVEYEVILNANHRSMWIAGIRELFGKDTDFSGPNGDRIPDTQISIRWCPYFGKMPIVIFQIPGNIQCLELLPGEMHKLGFETEMENVKVWSTWKEGTSAAYVGKPFGTKAACAENDFVEQQIFMNKPAAFIDNDSDTVKITGDTRIYITDGASAGKAITAIEGAKEGVAYMIEVGTEPNPQKIAKSGVFDQITSAYTPTKKGDYILLVMPDKASGKFYELERCVDGTRKINQALQPNVFGEGGR